MHRKTAIKAAKQAYRLYINQGLVAPGLTIHVWGFAINLPDWEIILTKDGKLDAILRKGK